MNGHDLKHLNIRWITTFAKGIFMKDNSVIFKANKEGLLIVLDEDAQFDNLKTVLSKKVSEARSFFDNSKTTLQFKGRYLTSSQEEELLSIINNNTNLNISFSPMYKREKNKVNNYNKNLEIIPIEKWLAPKVQENETTKQQKKIMPRLSTVSKVSENQNDTLFHRGSLRSGQFIKHIGSVVVIGDVNPGAEISAHGNIIILGSLKGLVHAGIKNNSECFVAALDLSPTQIRIADLITFIPQEMLSKRIPSIAYAENKQIYIAPLL